MLVFLSLVLFVMGGFCFVLTDTAVSYVEASFDTILLGVDPARRDELSVESIVVDLRIYLYASGGVAWLMTLLLLVVMSNVVRLVTAAKAFSVLLQATNLTIVPLGIALIAAGLYVADTAATVEAPLAAFAVFLMGFLVVFFAIVGCVGVTISSRGIIRLYQFLVGILGLLFFAAGIASLVVADTVRDQLLAQWDDIRRILPPSFSGKYDQGQFQAFVDTNLKAIGFMALCAGIILLIQLWAATRLRGEIKRMNDVEDRVDTLFNSLVTIIHNLQDAETAHRAARVALQRTGRSQATVRAIAASMASQCQREFETEADRLEQEAQLNEWDEEEVDARLASVPERWGGEDAELKALRTAEWNRLHLQAQKVAVEAEIHGLDWRRIEDEGVGGVVEAEKRMEVKGEGAKSVDPEDKFSVPKRRDRKLNAGALFWKRWWTKGTRGSRTAVMVCCCVFVFLIVLILGLASAALYFATSCSSLAGFRLAKPFDDIPTQHLWVKTAVRRGVLSLQPAEVTATKLTITKSSFQDGMISTDFPALGPDQPAEGETAKPGQGVSMSEPPPTRIISFDIACQTSDAAFLIPQRSTGSSTSSGGSAAADGSARRLDAWEPSARNRAQALRSFLGRRIRSGAAPSARMTQTSSEANSGSGSSTSPVEQANNANRKEGGASVSAASPGAWISTDLVEVVVDAIEAAAAASASSGDPATVAPPTAPVFSADAVGNLASVRLDWTATPHSARPFLYSVDVTSVAGADLTGVLLGGRGAAVTTELGDLTLTDVGAVCDVSDLGTGNGGLRLATDKGTVSIIGSVVYNCDLTMSGEASLVRLVNTVLLNENGGGSATLAAAKGSLLAEHVNAERLALQGREGSARVVSSEIRESLKISTTAGSVLISDLVAGARAVIQVETNDGSIVLRVKQFQGIVSVVTGGSVKCSGEGFEKRYSSDGTTEIDPCRNSAAAGSSLTFVEEARVNCVTAANRNDCAYLGEVTIVSNSGNVILDFAKYTAASAST